MKKLLLVFVLLSSVLFSVAQWNPNTTVNNLVYNGNTLDREPFSVTDGSGGSIIIFLRSTLTTGTESIGAQRMSVDGNLLWGTSTTSKTICNTATLKNSLTAIPDGAGGAFVAWSEERFVDGFGEIFVQRINSSGDVLWATDGVRITTTNANDDFDPYLAIDGAGGVIVGWSWDNRVSNAQCLVQRLDANGNAQWTPGGISVTTAPGFRFSSGMVSDGSGGVIVVFPDSRNDPHGLDYTYISENGSTNLDIYAQRINGSGIPQWNAAGVAVCTAAKNQVSYGHVVTDSSGGVITIIEDYRNDVPDADGDATNIDIYAQRVNAGGAVQWTANGVPVVTTPGIQYPMQISPGKGGSVVTVWQNYTASGMLYAQQTTSTGTNAWATNGVLCSGTYNGSMSTPAISQDGLGNTLVAFSTFNTGNTKLYGQKINGTGALQWEPEGKIICNAPNGFQETPSIVVSYAGNMIVTWEDSRNAATRRDIYCARVDAAPTPPLPPVPQILDVSNKCVNANTAKGKLANPPAADLIELTLDGSPITYSPADSSFIYFTNGITTVGAHTLKVKYTNPAGSSEKDSSYNVTTTAVPAVTIAASATTICTGSNITFTASPVNGGVAPSYQWQLNGVNVGTGGSTYSNNSLSNGDQVKVTMTSSSTCAAPLTATSNTINITLTTTITPSVSIAASASTICSGTNVVFTATPTNGGPTPNYQWQLNGINVGTGGSTFSGTLWNTGDQVKVVMTGSLTCASPATATSNVVTMTVNPTVIASVNIAASASTICPGTTVNFTATATNGGSSPTFQWQINGANVGSGGTTFENSFLGNGDQVKVTMTGSLGCATPLNVTSNVITMVVTPPLTPSVTIAASATTICAGTNVVFTAAPVNGGTAPSYQWKRNGTNVGTNTTTYSNNALANGDVISVSMISNASCVTVGAVNSNNITMALTTTAPPKPTITRVGADLVSSAATGNQWFNNGVPVTGATAQTYRPAAPGLYSVQVTTGGCVSPASDSYYYLVTAINDPLAIENNVMLRPNPVEKELLVINQYSNSVQMQMFDMSGKKLMTLTVPPGSKTVDVTGLPPGVYMAVIEDTQKKKTFRKLLIKK